ncbi:MAG: hypothetical protein KDA96_05555 [Planctomycetaceae bacterium]|nr:hypothetical protein [Planctomycetaceae bacterium]
MDFNIRPLARHCAESGRAFQPGEYCWSVLIEQDGKLVRRDVSAECWNGPPDGAIGHWKCQVPLSTESNRPKLDSESLFEYFQQLDESPNPVQQQYRYVLSLLLLRKKRLILEEIVEHDDQQFMRLIGSTGEGPFEVAEQELSEEQIQRLQEQLFSNDRKQAA